ncbi:MAG: hypothetical protein JF616_05970 [Fibrobacteres bacterium]|jgi:tetratricopeptide (TPR) repeat protein|nr:hypothetical protein [Fibrobacterota bacterium]
MRFLLLLASALAVATARSEPSLKRAAALYHQGRYDSALAVLETCRTIALRHRDSLALFQYSGMASARLGKSEEANADFRALLELDSLFQFPRNEDSAILASFAQAQQGRSASPSKDNDSASGRDSPPRVASAGRGTGTALPVSLIVPSDKLVPIPSYPGSGPSAGSAPPAPFPSSAGKNGPPGIGLAMGAIPLGGGWLYRGRRKQGLTLAILQAGGLAFSLYASSQMSAAERDADGIRGHAELGNELRWQWTQRVTLSIALGAYLFSLIASRGE